MPTCHHDIRSLRDGTKFCQKCFSEWPCKMQKANDYFAKLRRNKIAAQAKRRKNVDIIIASPPIGVPSNRRGHGLKKLDIKLVRAEAEKVPSVEPARL